MHTRKASRIIGIGNPLMGDDGLGIEAIERLRRLPLPPDIELVDGGCGGLTLLQLLEECERALIIDAADFGQSPGDIRRLTADEVIAWHSNTTRLSLHQSGFAEVLDCARKLGQLPETALLLMQPQNLARGLGLSPPVLAALPRLLEMTAREVAAWR